MVKGFLERWGAEICAKMKENQAMCSLLKRRDHSIPLGVRYWAFYKGNVLENDNGRAVESLEEFQQLLRPLLKSSPCRPNAKRSRATSERLTRDMTNVLHAYHQTLFGPNVPWKLQKTDTGVGVFARKDFEWTSEHAKLLFGVVSGVSDADFSELQSNGYPSLFNARGVGGGILFGPASLVNHACDAQLAFSAPTERSVPNAFEGFHSLKLKPRRAGAVRFRQGEEICAVYGMKAKNFTCGCRKCTK